MKSRIEQIQSCIICFLADNRSFVVHRYIDTDENDYLITKGDNNPREDFEHINLEQVEGKVVLRMNSTVPIISLLLQEDVGSFRRR